jgi:hypothetical protein
MVCWPRFKDSRRISRNRLFEEEKALIKAGNNDSVNRAVKVAEQARAALPKLLEGARVMVKQANELVT